MTMFLPILSLFLVPNFVAAHQSNLPEQNKDECAAVSNFDIAAEKVTFPGPKGKPLYGWLYKPKGKGPFPAVIWNHGSDLMNDPTLPYYRKDLAALYTGGGYVFFTPHRTGHGVSREAGESTVQKERDCVGPDIEKVQKCRVNYLDAANLDTIAAVKWLQSQSFVNKDRIAMSGVSYGGIQSILTAEKNPGIRAFVPFSPAAMGWANPYLRERLQKALEKATAPVFLIQAEGDYSTGPYEVLGSYLQHKGGLNQAKLYPKFGTTQREAHAVFAITCQGTEIWGKDVLKFLKAAMK